MHRNFRKTAKRGLAILLSVLIILCFYYREEILYGLSQGYGQMRIIWKAEPVAEVLEDASFPDSLKPRIHLVQEIRRFAFDSLGLDYSDNYTTVYNQHGKPVLWVLTASEPYQLKAKEWSFPFLGTFSYKGFFVHEKAVKEEAELKEQGLDTDIGEVSGWSTLGWFRDPILSNMLLRSPGNLANLIIHELTHGTLYVKNNVQFNENLASFVGDKGALRFLEFRYGKNSLELAGYVADRTFNKEFTAKVLEEGKRLDSLYARIAGKPGAVRENLKARLMQEIKNDLISFLTKYKLKNDTRIRREIEKINNTFFLDYRRYEEDLDQFEEEFRQRFGGDIKAYITYLKKKYPSL